MFGGGAKKEKKDEDEGRGDNSGSNKAQRDAAAAAKEGGEEVSCEVPRLSLRVRLRSSAPLMSFLMTNFRPFFLAG